MTTHNTHMFSYVINLTQLMLMKLEGYSIVGCEPVHRLVEIRTVRIMSKMPCWNVATVDIHIISTACRFWKRFNHWIRS